MKSPIHLLLESHVSPLQLDKYLCDARREVKTGQITSNEAACFFNRAFGLGLESKEQFIRLAWIIQTGDWKRNSEFTHV